jgi:hypothetical protein
MEDYKNNNEVPGVEAPAVVPSLISSLAEQSLMLKDELMSLQRKVNMIADFSELKTNKEPPIEQKEPISIVEKLKHLNNFSDKLLYLAREINANLARSVG